MNEYFEVMQKVIQNEQEWLKAGLTIDELAEWEYQTIFLGKDVTLVEILTGDYV